MHKQLLITHRFKNIPLVIALQELGVETVVCSNLHEARIKSPKTIGYFGSLFTELKKPFSLILLLHKLHKEQVPYIFWNRDSPWHCGIKKHRRFLLKILKPVDIYLAHSLQDYSWFTKREPIYFANGAQNEYIINDIPEELSNAAHYQYDVSFIGAIGNPDRINCRKRKKFLETVQKKIASYGMQVKFIIIDTYQNSMPIDKQISIIQKSKINLNIGAMCDLQDNPSLGLPERAFGIPAAGGFLLTDWRKNITNTFSENGCDYFHNPEECANKIIYFLRNFDLTRAHAEKLHNEVVNKYTYNISAANLLDILICYQQDHN